MVGVRVTLGVALAAVLVCALLAAPAFAQATAVGGSVQYIDCDQVQVAAADQYGVGDISERLDISQEQVLACLGDDDKDDGKTGADTKGKDDVLADTIVKGALPDTGGLPALALAAYALVVAGSFSVVRLVGRRG